MVCLCHYSPFLIGIAFSCIILVIFAVITLLFLRMKRRASSNEPLGTKFRGWALVTGASSGLGQKACIMLIKEQFEGIVLHASKRSKDSLEALAARIKSDSDGKVLTRIVLADLSDPDQVGQFIHQIKDINIKLLINNAGFGANGQFDKISLVEQLKMISVNCSAMVALTHHIVQEHRKTLKPSVEGQRKPSLAIVNIGSLAAAPPGLPWQTVYAASKSFVSSFTHGISYSLKDDGVRVLLVEPGTITDTEFQKRSEQPLHGGPNTTDSVLKQLLGMLRSNDYNNYHLIPSIHDYITYYGSKLLPASLTIKLGAKRGLKYSPEHLK